MPILLKQNPSDCLHFSFSFLPLLFHLALLEQSATGIEFTDAILQDVHAAERNEEMGLSLRRNRTDKTAIVFTGMKLMLQYEPASRILWDTTDCRRRIQSIEHIPQSAFIQQSERDIGTEMIKIGSHRGIRTFQSVIPSKALDAVFDIIRNILLLFPVLLRPFHALYRIISNGSGRLRLCVPAKDIV